MVDFYLTTAGEYSPLTQPRACIATGRLIDKLRDDYMLVDIDPPLMREPTEQDISQLLLASKWENETGTQLVLVPPILQKLAASSYNSL